MNLTFESLKQLVSKHTVKGYFTEQSIPYVANGDVQKAQTYVNYECVFSAVTLTKKPYHFIRASVIDHRRTVKLTGVIGIKINSIDGMNPIAWLKTQNIFKLNKNNDLTFSVESDGLENTTIHTIFVIDKSGSMYSEWQRTVMGLNDKIKVQLESAKKYPNQTYTFSVVLFSSQNSIDVLYENASPEEFDANFMARVDTYGLTALNDAIIKGINIGERISRPNDKVLLEVFTDGGENDSKNNTHHVLDAVAAAKANKLWTLAISGSGSTFEKYASRVGFYSTNILEFDLTEEGFEKQRTKSTRSLRTYAKATFDGLDTTETYYVDKD